MLYRLSSLLAFGPGWNVGSANPSPAARMTVRRVVRATASFFDDLDRQLPTEPGPNGEPSAHDSQVFELLRIVEEIATGFDQLPSLFPVREDYRILITTGLLVARFSIVAQLATDGAVELVELDLDLDHDP